MVVLLCRAGEMVGELIMLLGSLITVGIIGPRQGTPGGQVGDA